MASGYGLLGIMMVEEYKLTDFDVDELVADIEKMAAEYIMENSPIIKQD